MSAGSGRPDVGVLLDWLEGRLDPEAEARVAAQVAGGDARTRGTVEWLRGFLVTARTLPLHQPPPVVRQSLAQYFARWSRAQAALDHQPLELEARLLFDSRQDLVPAGVRAAADADEAVHLVYAADVADLLLDVYPLGGGHVRVAGQVLAAEPPDAPVFEASASGAGFTVRTRDGDELGRFTLDEVPGTRCQLRASNGVITLVADLDLGLEPDSGGGQP